MWIIHEWLTRLLRMRQQLEADAANGHEWLLRIRVRILNFLVSRYGEQRAETKPDDERADSEQAADPQGQLELPFPNFYVAPSAEKWAGGEASGPRKRTELREPLNNIRRINAEKRERWRWWL
jgi:hypothetical protein